VQDGNARFLGGLAGHAGLFAPAAGVLALAREWLRPQALLTRRQVERALAGTGPYALGWARRRVRGSAGAALAPSAFGHAGFTGGSVWIDPEQDRIFVWLGHRRSAASDLNAWRRRFHALASRV
jgi:CubicO group peptidase (beta-lactamase class C family)